VTDEPQPDVGADALPTAASDEATTPLDVDGVAAVAIGTVVWGVLLVACLLLRDPLAAAGRGWWWGVCLAGFLLGIPGLWFVRRRRDAYRRARVTALGSTTH
jgi:hypothetical protein